VSLALLGGRGGRRTQVPLHSIPQASPHHLHSFVPPVGIAWGCHRPISQNQPFFDSDHQAIFSIPPSPPLHIPTSPHPHIPTLHTPSPPTLSHTPPHYTIPTTPQGPHSQSAFHLSQPQSQTMAQSPASRLYSSALETPTVAPPCAPLPRHRVGIARFPFIQCVVDCVIFLVNLWCRQDTIRP